MKKKRMAAILLPAALASVPVLAQDTQPKDTVDLDSVIKQVTSALDDYQKNLGGGVDALPPLASAEFDFKTTVGKTVGGSINVLVFKIGASHEKDVVNDVTFTYALPKPPKSAAAAHTKKPPTLEDELANTIQAAAAAVKTAGTLGKLNFSKLSVNIQYGVKWDGNGGVNIPVSLVTVGLSGDVNKNTVQSVKLTFGQ